MTDDVKQQIADNLSHEHVLACHNRERLRALDDRDKARADNARLRTLLANAIDTLTARGFTQTAHHLTQELNK